MSLTEAQKLARQGKLTASRVACLMDGNKAKIMALWRELCGDPTYEEESLDDIWAVQLGTATEQLNLDWYEKIQQRTLERRGEVVPHPQYEWAAATLDAYDPILPGPVECKHVSGFEKFDTVLNRYQPQIHWQMECTQSKVAAFSVIEGSKKPRIEIVPYNKDYADEMMGRAIRFMEHVWNMTEPVEIEPVEYRVISRLKDYNMTGNNLWASAAQDWLDHRIAAKKFDEAESTIRRMVPDDAASATGYDLVVRRDRANRLTVRGLHDKPKRGEQQHGKPKL